MTAWVTPFLSGGGNLMHTSRAWKRRVSPPNLQHPAVERAAFVQLGFDRVHCVSATERCTAGKKVPSS
jgi:hypothetical protein